jgi:hypothetical protein
MPRFARGLGATLGIVLLGLFITLVPQRNASGAPPNTNVVVVNTPLPTIVTNTPLPVSGNLAATVSGNVNVGNFPATQNVNVTNTVPVSGTVTAQIATPVPVSGAVGINPSATTHVLQNASQLVQFTVFTNGFIQTSNTGAPASVFFTVPAGQVLILTDYEWQINGSTPNAVLCSLLELGSGFGLKSCAISDSNGNAAGSEHLTTGIVIGPGQMPAATTGGTAQGYLIANQ